MRRSSPPLPPVLTAVTMQSLSVMTRYSSGFVPIVRTFAPFVAGIGRMSYRRFALFNVAGGTSWVLLFLFAGYFFGNLPAVQKHFHYVIVAIIVISLIPIAVEWLRARRSVEPSALS